MELPRHLFVTVPEATRYLNISPTYMHRLIKAGYFDGAFRVRARILIPRDSVLNWRRYDPDARELPAESVKGSFNLPELAKRWRVGRDTIFRELQDGKLQAFTVRGHRRVDLKEVQLYERRHQIHPTDQEDELC